MKLFLIVTSFNDIITNSSTEILSIRTEETPEFLKELILNYAMGKDDYGILYGVDPSEVTINKIDISEGLEELYGEISQEENEKFRSILYKKFGFDPSIPGELYIIEIEKHLYDTINFLQNTLGAI